MIDKDDFLLYAALLLDHIWEVRNNFVFSGKSFNLEGSIQVLQCKFNDFVEAWELPLDRQMESRGFQTCLWAPPPRGCIKLNSDVAVRGMVGSLLLWLLGIVLRAVVVCMFLKKGAMSRQLRSVWVSCEPLRLLAMKVGNWSALRVMLEV